ncbi:PHB depolymerase family esterase [Streptomyces sp. 150FB]|uniref:PHB depolymerase family esterase n=1 Tax=Streptomyces sp. 150FB TaxID=1576605 RepID=UPI000696B639|nr:PHB depolymerase family esterase [Streptomyces sp. 150FB]
MTPAPTPASARVLDPVEFYHTGPTPFFASQQDQRFSYCLYVPTAHKEAPASARLPLVVLMHGTQRTAERYRDAYREFAEEHGCVILAPLFPAGIGEPGDLHAFKRIDGLGIRFDQVFLDIVEEVGRRYKVDTERLYLHGFSGGGQFAHRFAYLYPERLAALSIGAPGRITRISQELPWWQGTADIRERFGKDLDLAALRDTKIQMIVGGQDTDTWEIAEPDIDAGGDTRIERLTTLRDNFRQHNVPAQLDVVPGVAHKGFLMLPQVQGFFSAALPR